MPDYYATLGLTPQATAADIRQAYRRLVLLTHPDRTPDPAAHQRFLAVNEAYDVLSNPARRDAYDASRQRPAPPPAPSQQHNAPRPTPPASRRRPPGPRPPAPLAQRHYAAEFALLQPWVKALAALSLLLVMVLFADYLTTRTFPNETILHYDYVTHNSRAGRESYLVYHTELTRFRTTTAVDLNPGDRVAVMQTRWLGKPQAIRRRSGKLRGQYIAIAPKSLLVLGPAAVLFALAVLLLRLRPDQTFSFGFMNCVALLLLLLFYVF